MSERSAVFAGTFDPFTKGHLWVVEEGLRLFDKVVVLVATNAAKAEPLFGLNDRLGIVLQSVEALGVEANKRIIVAALADGEMTATWAVQHGHTALLRGCRSMEDFLYESDVDAFNRNLADIPTVMLAARWAINSTGVRNRLRSNGRVGPVDCGSISAEHLINKIYKETHNEPQ